MPIEINPPLKPDDGGGFKLPGFGGRAQAADQPLVPGFLLRAGAFFIDLLILYFLAMGANALLRPALLQLGRASVLPACLVLIAYFTCLNGPLGRGTTLGKQILGLRVVSLQGTPLSWGAALKRALVQTSPFLIMQVMQWLFWKPQTNPGGYIAVELLNRLAQGILVANAMLVLLNLSKRSFQDVAAHSLVVRNSHVDENLPQKIEYFTANTPRLAPFQRALVLAGFLIFAITTLPVLFQLIKSGGWQQSRNFDKRLTAILKDEALRVRMSGSADVPLGGEEAERAEAEKLRAGQKPGPGPRTLKFFFSLASYRDLSQEELDALKRRLPQMLPWVADLVQQQLTAAENDPKQTKNVAERRKTLNERNVHQAFLEIQVYEVLDLGFEFPGKPVLTFRRDFNPGQIKLLDIPASTQPTQATRPTTAPAT